MKLPISHSCRAAEQNMGASKLSKSVHKANSRIEFAPVQRGKSLKPLAIQIYMSASPERGQVETDSGQGWHRFRPEQ
jgi:hypothetical protein